MMPQNILNPSASSEYIAPRLSPLMICCSRTSWKLMLPDPQETRRRLRSGRRHANVLVLELDIVQRVGGILVDLEDADDLVVDVAVLVERNLALQRLHMGGLDGVAHV